MYAIENKSNGQWAAESGNTHFTNRIDLAAVFHEYHQAYRAMKKLEKIFSGHSFKISKLDI